MTLIIGCITSEFAVLAGDTQLTVGDLQRGENLKREIEIKVKKYSHRFMVGILGKWSYFDPTADGKATYINYYDTLKKRLHNNEDEVAYINEFLQNKKDIDAVAIYINKNENDFIMDAVSSKDDVDLGRITIGEKKIIFNEPFYNLQSGMISEKLSDFSRYNNLDDSLGDVLFLLNNTILSIIASGKEIDIRKDDGVLELNVKNTVGGYVTIQILTSDNYTFNCLYKPYDYDYNTLLDKTTFAFSSFVDRNPEIRYLDNIVMLVRGIVSEWNDPFVKAELIKCVEKQLKFLADSDLVRIYILNDFISLINGKYTLKFDPIEVEDKPLLQLNLGDFLEGEIENVDMEYIKRFI